MSKQFNDEFDRLRRRIRVWRFTVTALLVAVFASAILYTVSATYKRWRQQEEIKRQVELASQKKLQTDREHRKTRIQRDIKDLQLSGKVLMGTAQYERALSTFRQAAALIDKDTDPLSWADSQNHVAVALQRMAQFAEAIHLLEQVVQIRERELGPDAPELANALHNLARLFHDTNRLEEAEALMRRALAIKQMWYGVEHPNVVATLNNLAQLLHDTNRPGEAEALMRQVLAIDEKWYGAKNRQFASHLNGLAFLLMNTNRLDEAESLMRRALAIDEQTHQIDHPETDANLSNLAKLLRATNRLKEAEAVMRRSLAIDERVYGIDHPNVASNLNALPHILMDSKRLSEAEPLLRRALKIDELALGTEHPTVAIRLNSLGLLLQDTNRLEEAESMMRRAVQIFVTFLRTNGHEHQHMHAGIENYKLLLKELGRNDDEIDQQLSEIMNAKTIEKRMSKVNRLQPSTFCVRHSIFRPLQPFSRTVSRGIVMQQTDDTAMTTR